MVKEDEIDFNWKYVELNYYTSKYILTLKSCSTEDYMDYYSPPDCIILFQDTLTLKFIDKLYFGDFEKICIFENLKFKNYSTDLNFLKEEIVNHIKNFYKYAVFL